MDEQLRNAVIEVEVDPEFYPNALYARLKGPVGISIQLWEPDVEDAIRLVAIT